MGKERINGKEEVILIKRNETDSWGGLRRNRLHGEALWAAKRSLSRKRDLYINAWKVENKKELMRRGMTFGNAIMGYGLVLTREVSKTTPGIL